MPAIEPRWLNPADAAAYIGRHRDELKRLVRAGKIPPPSYHFGPRSPRYDRLALDALFTGTKAANDLDAAFGDAINAHFERHARGQKTARGRHR